MKNYTLAFATLKAEALGALKKELKKRGGEYHYEDMPVVYMLDNYESGYDNYRVLASRIDAYGDVSILAYWLEGDAENQDWYDARKVLGEDIPLLLEELV